MPVFDTEVTGLKYCPKCDKTLPHTRFGTRSWVNQDGTTTKTRKSHCRDCVSKANLVRYHKNPTTKAAYRRASYKHRLKSYGLTPDDYEVLFEAAGGRCEVCGDIPDRVLSLDHCHTTGKIRGLLCNPCNSALGLVREDVQVLEKLIAYIRKHE